MSWCSLDCTDSCERHEKTTKWVSWSQYRVAPYWQLGADMRCGTCDSGCERAKYIAGRRTTRNKWSWSRNLSQRGMHVKCWVMWLQIGARPKQGNFRSWRTWIPANNEAQDAFKQFISCYEIFSSRCYDTGTYPWVGRHKDFKLPLEDQALRVSGVDCTCLHCVPTHLFLLTITQNYVSLIFAKSHKDAHESCFTAENCKVLAISHRHRML